MRPLFSYRFIGAAIDRIWFLWQVYGGIGGLILLLVYFSIVVIISYKFPGANWDMLAYVAAATEHNSTDVEELHRLAFEAVQSRVSDGEFLMLTADRAYRVRQFEDASAFASMLGFYRVKYLYVMIASWLSGVMQPVDALRLISTVSAGAIGLVILYWAYVRRIIVLAPMIVTVLALCDFGYIARYVAPDLLGSFFLISAAILFLEKRSMSCAILLVLACLARPDHLAFVAALAVSAALTGRDLKPVALAFFAGLVLSIAVAKSAGHPGWWVQMWFTHVEYVPTLTGFDPEFSVRTYIEILMRVLARSIVEENWPALALLYVAIAAFMVKARLRVAPRAAAVLLAIALCEPAKFIAAPLDETRFHFAYFVIFGLILIEWVRRLNVEKHELVFV